MPRPILRQAGDLLRGIDADLLQQRADDVLESSSGSGTPGVCKAWPIHCSTPSIRRGTIRTTRWSCSAHAGHHDVDAVEHLEDRPHAASRRASSGRGSRQGRTGYRPPAACSRSRGSCFARSGRSGPSFSPPNPWLTTLARHCPQTTSETEAGSKPSADSFSSAADRALTWRPGASCRSAGPRDRCWPPGPATSRMSRSSSGRCRACPTVPRRASARGLPGSAPGTPRAIADQLAKAQ